MEINKTEVIEVLQLQNEALNNGTSKHNIFLKTRLMPWLAGV